MNKSNIEYLQRSLKYLGFGTALNGVLEEKITEGKDKFQIASSAQFENKHSLRDRDHPQDTINYRLNFSKSKKTDNYFLNSYNASLEKGSAGKAVDPVSQTFYLNKGNDITAKEAYNLLSGRAVMKTVDVGERLDLLERDRKGKTVSETKVRNLWEAKEKMMFKINDDRQEKPGSFELRYKGETIRTFNSDGKSKPLQTEGLELVRNYYDAAKKETSSESFAVENLKTAKELIAKIMEVQSDKNQTWNFAVRTPGSQVPSYRFDNEGKELDIAPESRKEELWLKLDLEKPESNGRRKFRRFYENYGFDLNKELQKMPIVEMKGPEQKDRLLGSLKRGNLQSVRLEDEKEPVYISANPQFKRLDVYDKELKEVYQSRKEEANNGMEEEVAAGRGR